MDLLFNHYIYWVSMLLMMIGFYGIIVHGNFVKKIMSLSIFQVSVLLLYISIGYVKDGAPPIITKDNTIYVNPLPQVLMLTAIVVGVSVMALGLALIVRIKSAYGTVEEKEIFQLEEKSKNDTK